MSFQASHPFMPRQMSPLNLQCSVNMPVRALTPYVSKKNLCLPQPSFLQYPDLLLSSSILIKSEEWLWCGEVVLRPLNTSVADHIHMTRYPIQGDSVTSSQFVQPTSNSHTSLELMTFKLRALIASVIQQRLSPVQDVSLT